MEDQSELHTVQESLRVMLELIDAGSVTASDVQRAYLAGFIDGLALNSVHDTDV